MAEDTYKQLNDVEIDSILLRSDQGGEVDISKMCKHVSIFEDMFSTCTEGYALIVDAMGLINHLPIIGQETISISFKTPGFGNNLLELSFEVYGIEGRTKSSNDKSEIYEMKFISKEFRESKIRRISRAYHGRISDIVADVFFNYFPNTEATILKTRGEYKYTIPNWTPFDTLDWLSSRAISDEGKGNANYVLFQKKGGYVFAPISSMSKIKPKYAYEVAPTAVDTKAGSSGNVLKQFFNIQEYSIPNQFNRLEELNDSMYSSNLLVHDIVNKNYSSSYRKYIESFADSDKCEEFPYLPIKNRYSSTPLATSFVRTKHQGLHDDYPDTQNTEEWLLKRNATMKEMDTTKIKITVAGNSDLSVGDTLRLRFPVSEPVGRVDSDWSDKYSDGTYLITAIRHSINLATEPKEYNCIIELSRDSIPERVPDRSTILGTGRDTNNQSNTNFLTG